MRSASRLCALMLLLATASLASGSTIAASGATKTPVADDDTASETHLPAGRFGKVTVYIPEGTPQSVAIFLSGDGGWHLGVLNMAKALQEHGAVVIGADVTHYLASLGAAAASGKSTCQLIAGDFENLS